MKKILAYAAPTLAFALLAACATQPAPIPSFLAPTFAVMKLDKVASISYEDEQGRPISEDKFAAPFKNGQNYEAVKDASSMPNVRLRLRPGNTDGNPRKAVSFPGKGTPPPGSIADISTCSPPVYPASEVRANHTGTVMLKFLIGTGGEVKQAEVEISSGFPRLDEAAKLALSRCRFIPASSDGIPVEKWVPFKYVWTIQ